MEGRYENLISVGKEKGGWNFWVRAAVRDLSPKEMKKVRNMLVVAIGTMEDMWRRAMEEKMPPAQTTDV